MFEIDDDFLVSVGYDLALLTDEQIEQYKKEMTEEMTARLSEHFAGELTEEQSAEFEGLQNNTERARQWLVEFHAGYQENDDFKAFTDAVDDQDEATRFYACSLWMNDAVPNYGELIQKEMDEYQAELTEKRRMANQALADLI